MTWDVSTPGAVGHLLTELRRQGGDLTDVEVKRGHSGVPGLGETLCAFGNMPEGGLILIGIDEATDFAVTGVDDLAAMQAGIASQARNAIEPAVTVDLSTAAMPGGDIVICQAAGLPLESRPCRYRGKSYLRQFDGDYVMSDAELALLEHRKDLKRIQSRDGRQWVPADRFAVPDSNVDDLRPDVLQTVLTNARARNSHHRDKPDDVLLRRLGIVTSDGLLTVAGAYVLGDYPQQFQPSWAVSAAVVLPRGSTARTRDLQHFEGPVPDLLEQARDWVLRNQANTVVYRPDGGAVTLDAIPPLAVREIVANALVHRDLSGLSAGMSVDLRIRAGRLVIASPGGLYGLSQGQLGTGARYAVNPTVYALCRLLTLSDGSNLIEAKGGGIREAVASVHDAGLEPIRFYDSDARFTVVMEPRDGRGPGSLPISTPETTRVISSGTGTESSSPDPASDFDANMREVWNKLGDGVPDSAEAGPTVAQLAQLTGLTERQIRLALGRLEDKNVVISQGKRPKHYQRRQWSSLLLENT